MTENRKEHQDIYSQTSCLTGNCIIVSGIMKVAQLIKGLFKKEDKKESANSSST